MAIHKNCHLISIVGGKGGVGKSVFSANLAATFLQELKARTLLLDLDSRSCGDQNILMGKRPIKTISEITRFTGQINKQTIPSLATPLSSGLFYIGAVKSPSESLHLNPQLAVSQIERFSPYFNFIIADLGSELEELQFSIIEKSSAILLVTTPEVLSVNQTLKKSHEIMSTSLPGELLLTVVNRSNRLGLSPQAIAKTLNRQLIGVIPQDDSNVLSSVQSGTPFVISQPNLPITHSYHEVVRRLTNSGLLNKLKTLTHNTKLKKPITQKTSPTSSRKQMTDAPPPNVLLKLRVHQALISAMDLKKGITNTKDDPSKEQALRQKTQRTISEILDREQKGLSREERSQIIKEILDEALGLGPLEELLENNDVTEVMVNGPHKIFIEKRGKVQHSPVTFTGNLQLRNVIERIVTPLGRRIDEKTPYVDARLKDGSRVNAVIEPLSIDGPSLTIRKFAKTPITPKDYVQWNSMTQDMLDFFKICVENGLNIIISGGTGSGKTTLLNVLSGFVPSKERIITVEDAAELQLKQEHVVRLETRPANMEGSGAITIRDLVKNTLRMRPDRIIVGECRGGEALDMLSAMNTGHDGSMTTVHANNPREAISRLETLCLMAGIELPVKAIREQISQAINMIIQISRLSDGSRKITNVTEIVGMQGDKVTLQEIFCFKEKGFDKNRKIIGQFEALGLIPSFVEEFERKGIKIPRSLFTNEKRERKREQPRRPMRKASGERR